MRKLRMRKKLRGYGKKQIIEKMIDVKKNTKMRELYKFF